MGTGVAIHHFTSGGGIEMLCVVVLGCHLPGLIALVRSKGAET
jgi:hypothetical protein